MSHPLVRPAARATAVLATALALVIGTLTPAQAVYHGRPWISAFCATGQFTAIETGAYGHVALHGDVTTCTPYLSNSAFTLVVFHPAATTAYAYSNSLVLYKPKGPTPFSGVFGSVPAAREAGVCAMGSRTDRIACVRVTWPAAGPATMEPIPTTDPLVDKVVTYVDEQGGPTPPPSGFCGTCLGLPAS